MKKAALPLGIALVGGGAILLFIAFHNLPSNVTNFPELIGYIAASFRGTATGKTQGSATQTPPPGGGFQIPPLPPPLGGPLPVPPLII